MMIHEHAEIDVALGKEQAFEAAVRAALPLFLAAKGCHGLRLMRSIEHAGRYRLLVEWNSVENHMVDFRESAAFAEWRRLVGPSFAAAPRVEHLETVVAG